MSLRSRVVALLALVLFVGVLLGAFAAAYQAKHALSAELNAALRGAEQTVDSAFEDLPVSDHQARDLHQLVATFDGNRHVEATLLNADGARIESSRTDRSRASAPQWFMALVGRAPADRQVRTPEGVKGFYAIVLAPTPAIDAAAAWSEFSGVVLVLVVSFAVGLVLVYIAIGAALRPLTALAAEFERIGAGDYRGRVRVVGPSDVVKLQIGFNAMAERLSATIDRNRQLNDQLLTIQDEERADIARDLHDEIGPHLFSVNMDAELIAQLHESGRNSAIPERIASMRSAISHMQAQVRDLLGRLRPARATEFGLDAALQGLIRFWNARRPDIRFDYDFRGVEETAPELLRETAYRIVQEAASNAVRHGHPTLVTLSVEVRDQSDLLVIVADDGKIVNQPGGGGFGLVGMRERVAAAGGSITAGPTAGGAGWTVVARLPIRQAFADTPIGSTP